MSTGAAVAAAAKRAERRLVEHLREAGALTEGSAVALTDQRWMGKRVLSRLVAAGAIREAGTGYYLEEPVYEAYRARRRRNTIIAVGAAAVVAILVIWWASMR